MSLKQYYSDFFPLETFCQFYTLHKPLANREFNFVVNDRYSRYRAYKSSDDLRRELLRDSPEKIDIGAVYNCSPRQRENLTPVAKEICIDIDISDYDDVRTCCSGAAKCAKCWKLMHAATDLLNFSLRSWFGFKNIMWVFSGRRGIHGWIYDECIMEYSHELRSSVAEFIHLVGKNDGKTSLNLTTIHPSFREGSALFNRAESWFLKCAEEMEWFSKGTICNFAAPQIDEEIAQVIAQYKEEDETLSDVEAVWDAIKEKLKESDKKRGYKDQRGKESILRIVYSCVYPRLDVEVSKTTHHLLKAPFAVHPGTNTICVVIPKEQELTFNPDTDAPRLDALIAGDATAKQLFQKSVDAFENCLNH